MRGNFILSIAMVALAIAALKLSFFDNPWSELPISERETIVVEGHGAVVAPHTGATVYVSVSNDGETPEATITQNNILIGSVMTRLGQLEVSSEQITTEIVTLHTIREQLEYGEARLAEVVGFRAENKIQLHFDNVEDVGAVLHAVIQAGATEVAGPFADVIEDETYANQARDLAIADARRRAEQIAEASGVQLGALIQIQETRYVPEFDWEEMALRSRGEMLSVTPEIPLEFGQEILDRAVMVTYEIE